MFLYKVSFCLGCKVSPDEMSLVNYFAHALDNGLMCLLASRTDDDDMGSINSR